MGHGQKEIVALRGQSLWGDFCLDFRIFWCKFRPKEVVGLGTDTTHPGLTPPLPVPLCSLPCRREGGGGCAAQWRSCSARYAAPSPSQRRAAGGAPARASSPLHRAVAAGVRRALVCHSNWCVIESNCSARISGAAFVILSCDFICE